MDSQTKKFIDAIRPAIGAGGIGSTEEKGGCLFLSASPAALLSACRACLTAGAVFDSAFVSKAAGSGKDFTVHYLFRAPSMHRMVVLCSTGKSFSALSSIAAAALWDERKMQDLTGMRFKGIPDTRPLIFHSESGVPSTHPLGGTATGKEMRAPYAMQGTGAEGEFEVAVGPVHAGIIEPGHFRFHVVGEKINKMEVRMFYLHRGIEKAAEGKQASELLPLIEQISGDETMASSVAYCHAVERALGVAVPKRAEHIRAILMELERIYSHLADLGGMPTDVGFTLVASRFAVMREDMMRLNQKVSGNRFLRGMCAVGGVSGDIDKEKTAAIKNELSLMLQSLESTEHVALSSPTFLNRIYQAGTVSLRTAKDLALVGPGARASGLESDLRIALPYSAYSGMAINEPIEKNGGDVLARFTVKIAEVKESARLIKLLLSNLPSGTLCSSLPNPKKQNAQIIGIGWAESARGGSTFLVKLSPDHTVRRLACRLASFRNWRALEKAVEGNIVPDFPLINKSFNLSYAGTDL